MLEYNRIDISEGVDTTQNKVVSRECSLCHFWYFVDQKFKYQRYLCDGYHDMSMKATSMNNLVIVYHGLDAYRVNFIFMNLNEAINLVKKSLIVDKRGRLH